MTIEFKFHRPPGHSPRPEMSDPFILLTHKNVIDSPLLSIIRAHVPEHARSKKDSAIPRWVRSLVFPDPDDPDSFNPPQCVMPAKLDPLSTALQVKTGYYDMRPSEKLSVLLRGTHFVEFPTIEVWEEFRGTIVDTTGAITRHFVADRRPKHPNWDPSAGKKTMETLLGGYGSDVEEGSDGEGDNPTALAALAGYAGSDDDHAEELAAESDECGSEGEGDDLGMDDGVDQDREHDEEPHLEPEALLELMRTIQADQKWNGEDDEVDWGGSDEDR